MTGASNWWTAFSQPDSCGAKKIEDPEVVHAVKTIARGMTLRTLGGALVGTAVAIAVPYLHLL